MDKYCVVQYTTMKLDFPSSVFWHHPECWLLKWWLWLLYFLLQCNFDLWLSRMKSRILQHFEPYSSLNNLLPEMKSGQASHKVVSSSIVIVDLFLNRSAEWLVLLKLCTGASAIRALVSVPRNELRMGTVLWGVGSKFEEQVREGWSGLCELLRCGGRTRSQLPCPCMAEEEGTAAELRLVQSRHWAPSYLKCYPQALLLHPHPATFS